MDAVSNCIMELIFHTKRLPPVLNLVHPRPTKWNKVIKLIGDALVSQKRLSEPLDLISIREWFYILESHAKAANQENKNELKIVRLSIFLGFTTFTDFFFCLACCQTSRLLPTNVRRRFESDV